MQIQGRGTSSLVIDGVADLSLIGLDEWFGTLAADQMGGLRFGRCLQKRSELRILGRYEPLW